MRMERATKCVTDTPRKRGVDPKRWCTPQVYTQQGAQSKSQETSSSLRVDANWVHHPHKDALVVMAKIANNIIHKMQVDNGSAANILF